WLARGELVRLGIAVVGRPALHRVADVDVLAAQAHRLDHLGEELSRLPHEGLALLVLVLPGPLAYEHEPRAGIADPEDEVGAALVELAAGAIAELLAHRFEADEGKLAGHGRSGV